MVRMGRWRRTTACERAAQWISLELDDELGGLERDGLARHLGRCEECRLLKADVEAFTTLLRDAPPLARELVASATGEVRKPGERARRAVLTGALAATLAVAAALFLVPRSSVTGASTPGFQTASQQLEFAREEHLRIEPVARVLPERPPLQAPGFRALD